MSLGQDLEFRLKRRFRKQKNHRGILLDLTRPEIDGPVRDRILRGRYEQAECGILNRLLGPESRLLELGSCVGFLSAFAAKRCGDANVMTIEANPELLDLIAHTHALNDVHPRVLSGLADIVDGAARDFFVQGAVWASSALDEAGGRRITQQTIDVNRVIREFAPTVLMMDIEGAEVDLLPFIELGSVEHVIVEFHPDKTGDRPISRSIQSLLDRHYTLRLSHSAQSVLTFSHASD